MRPRDPAFTDPTDDQSADLRDRLLDAVAELAAQISTREQELTATGQTPTQFVREHALMTPDWHLSVLRALREGRDVIEQLADTSARSAGAAGANYPQLGAAWGISRQAARKRWLGAVSAANETANKEPVEIRAFGGEARVAFHVDEGGWWWIGHGADGTPGDAGDDVTYDTKEEAAAHAGAFLQQHAVKETHA